MVSLWTCKKSFGVTVSETNKFNTTAFRSKFLLPLGNVINCSNDDVGIGITVPKGVEFMISKDFNEFSPSSVSIDCTCIDMQKLTFPFLKPTSVLLSTPDEPQHISGQLR